MAGALLVCLECNRPGRIVPGASGLLLLLLGVWRLQGLAGSDDGSLGWGLAGVAFLGVLRWRLLYGVPGVLGTGFLTAALVRLAVCSHGEIRVDLAVACGLVLGAVGSGLMVIAGQARRTKFGHRSPSAGRARTGVVERWE